MNETPSQTVGPFFSIGLRWLNGVGDGALEVTGRVLDGAGDSVPDALVEASTADAFRRAFTDTDGVYRFRINRPRATGQFQAPGEV